MQPRQNAIADELVERHPSFNSIPAPQEAAAVNGVRTSGPGVFSQDFGQVLRGIQTIAVEKYYNVKAPRDSIEISESLIAAVTLIIRSRKHTKWCAPFSPPSAGSALDRQIRRAIIYYEDLS